MKRILLLLIAMLSLYCDAQEAFTMDNSYQWLQPPIVVPDNFPDKDKLPTIYIYNIPDTVRFTLADNIDIPDNFQIESLHGTFDYEQVNYESQTMVTFAYYDTSDHLSKRETLMMLKDNSNPNMLILPLAHKLGGVIDYLLHSEGYMTISFPILGRYTPTTIKLPCIKNKHNS